jgi:hypothetical protein
MVEQSDRAPRGAMKCYPFQAKKTRRHIAAVIPEHFAYSSDQQLASTERRPCFLGAD